MIEQKERSIQEAREQRELEEMKRKRSRLGRSGLAQLAAARRCVPLCHNAPRVTSRVRAYVFFYVGARAQPHWNSSATGAGRARRAGEWRGFGPL